ncbi:MAG: hypothetical protein JO057_15880 [Chloroflexi bacterium]|nr:hypothetical protein [Chloroflexota bacterium]
MSQPEEQGSGLLVRILEVLVVVAALLRRRPAPTLPSGVDAEDLGGGYEHSDMNPLVVVGAALALVGMLVLLFVVVSLFEQAVVGLPFTISRPEDLIGGLQAPAAPTPPAPALEAQSGQTSNPYRAAEEQKLNSYAWVDRSAGVVRIPIDRAMDLTAERGLAARPAPSATPQDDGGTSPSMASSGRVKESYP